MKNAIPNDFKYGIEEMGINEGSDILCCGYVRDSKKLAQIYADFKFNLKFA